MPLTELEQSLSGIAKVIDSIRFDPADYEGQVVDEKLVDWYRQRFEMFVADGCRSCINTYMQKAQTEKTNQLTKLVILHLGLNS